MKKQKYLFLALFIPLLASCIAPIEIIHPKSSNSTSSFSQISSSSPSSAFSSSSASSSDRPSSLSTSSSSSSSSKPSSSSISNSTPSSNSSSSGTNSGYDLSQYYDGYYTNFTWTDGVDLKEKLYNIMRNGYNSLKYDWLVNEKADISIDKLEYLDVVYSANDILIDSSTRNNVWNKEHAFPASLMCGVSTSTATNTLGRATDYHNLFAAFSSGNSSRGNQNFGEIANYSSEKGYTNDMNNPNGSTLFEPGEVDKGRLSRALFYMATMYYKDNVAPNANLKGLSLVEDIVTYPANGQGYEAYAHGRLTDLLAWSKKPVDRLEYQHNETVYSYQVSGKAQNNRNVYVDFPELVDYVFGSKKNQPGELKNLTPSAETLDINKSGVANYAIKTGKKEYDVGEQIKYSDFELVKVNNDFTTSPATSFTIKNVPDGSILQEGKHDLVFQTELNEIVYSVNVVNDPFKKAPYSHAFTFSEITKGASKLYGDLSLTIDWANSDAAKVGTDSANRGIQIGSSTKNPGDVTITLNNELTLKAIYFKFGMASKNTSTVKIYINNQLKETFNESYVANTPSNVYYILDVPIKGTFKIVFNAGSGAAYIHSLAIDYQS